MGYEGVDWNHLVHDRPKRWGTVNGIEYGLPCDTECVQQLMFSSDDSHCTLHFISYCL